MKNIYLLICLVGLSALVQAQKGNWKPDDVINQVSGEGFRFSPNGKMVVWVKRRPDKKKDRFISDLYLTRLDMTNKKGRYKTIQLTRSKDSDYSPVFSADSETIYFLSSRAKGKALWAMSTYGGAPYKVHTFKNSISNIHLRNQHTLFFVSSEGASYREQQLKKEKDNVVVVEDTEHMKATRVFSFNLKTKQIERQTDNRYPIVSLAVSKNGQWMVTTHLRSLHYASDGKPRPAYYIWNLKTGKKTAVLKDTYQGPGNFEFSEDNQGFYFTSTKSSDPEWGGAGVTKLHYMTVKNPQVVNIPVDWKWDLSYGLNIVGNDVLVYLANGPTNKLALMKKQGNRWAKQMVALGDMADHVSVRALSADKKQVVYLYSTASVPVQYRIGELVQKRKVSITAGKELITLNESWKKKKTSKSKVIKWQGYNNEEVDGILYYPQNYTKGKKYPLVVAIHGGPASTDRDAWSFRWAYPVQLFTQKGAFVFKPNYHGSSNHGLKFVESIKKNYYDLEMVDITKGIDFLADQGLIDKNKMGVMGWSNGAILTTMLTVRYPDMFKVAAAGAGDVNWTSDYGTCRFGVTFDQSYFGGAPWDDRNGKTYNEAYILKSPLFELEKVKTPTLIFHGSNDRAVPRDQGWEYYRALQQVGKAPVRFLWFPGQPHGLRKLTHQMRKVKEEQTWFDKYLFKTYEKPNESFSTKSPLALLLIKEKAANQDGVYGVMKNGVLTPEVAIIKKDSIAIGRFEVTNAQYRAFDTQHKFLVTEANHPATGIGTAKAKEYVAWLASKTGEKFRLPNEKEGKALHTQARTLAAKENSLNYWAGYKVTIDDVPGLEQKIAKLRTSLLMKGGSFKGTKVGKATIYDLGGNAAEYYTKANRLATYGYSAYDYADEGSQKVKTATKYVGIRVVKDLK
ncbi:prolyl oligopeptidase family serine peptidase [uncultured Microscilla sp.]|uniref:S9 family peptidase n=1 Tax=uncultured Microscilla sp. TaxID=432653 RepID=UPI0026340880|nr:prolyl oligopeptidase family serine peptidase [uncultured Microscilla sp.]